MRVTSGRTRSAVLLVLLVWCLIIDSFAVALRGHHGSGFHGRAANHRGPHGPHGPHPPHGPPTRHGPLQPSPPPPSPRNHAHHHHAPVPVPVPVPVPIPQPLPIGVGAGLGMGIGAGMGLGVGIGAALAELDSAAMTPPISSAYIGNAPPIAGVNPGVTVAVNNPGVATGPEMATAPAAQPTSEVVEVPSNATLIQPTSNPGVLSDSASTTRPLTSSPSVSATPLGYVRNEMPYASNYFSIHPYLPYNPSTGYQPHTNPWDTGSPQNEDDYSVYAAERLPHTSIPPPNSNRNTRQPVASALLNNPRAALFVYSRPVRQSVTFLRQRRGSLPKLRM